LGARQNKCCPPIRYRSFFKSSLPGSILDTSWRSS
jgi:hypothetical protein